MKSPDLLRLGDCPSACKLSIAHKNQKNNTGMNIMIDQLHEHYDPCYIIDGTVLEPITPHLPLHLCFPAYLLHLTNMLL